DRRTPGGRHHAAALRAVLHTYSRLALELPAEERVAFPLATGLGKTQSAVWWLRAAHRLGMNVSALVCQERIESLEDFYRDLTRDGGIPAEQIGLLHSSPDRATLPSIRPEDVQNYRYLLVTHARIKT